MEKKSLLCMRWGFVAAFVNVNIGRINVLPGFVGFFLFWLALRSHEEETGVEKLVIFVIGIYTLFVLLGEVMQRIGDTQTDVAESIGVCRILMVILIAFNYLAGAYDIEPVNLLLVVAILILTACLFVKTFSIVPLREGADQAQPAPPQEDSGGA